MTTKKAVIIGAGIGGLATAALLAKEGYIVIILEKNEQIGGRARMYREKGYSFDMGPSWYMMPEVFERYFAFFHTKSSEFYQLHKLKTHYKVFFSPKRTYEITSKLPTNVELFEKTEKGSGARFLSYLQKSKWIYETAMKELVLQDYQSLLPLLSPTNLLHLLQFNLFTSFHSYVKTFVHHPDLQKILEFTTVFLGGSPYNTPAFYSLVSHTDFNLGLYHPMGGMRKIVHALQTLCQRYHVSIRTSEEVKGITVTNNKITAVYTNHATYTADCFVGNADYHHIETHLIPHSHQTYPKDYWRKKQTAPSAFLMYIGIQGKLQNVHHHNLYFDSSWENHFDTVYDTPTWPDKPSYYVHCPSVTDTSLAPENGETLIFLVPVAAGLTDNPLIRKKMRDMVLSHFEQLIQQPIKNKIVVEKIFAHADFIHDYNAYKGAAFGLAHTLLQTAFFRPLNKSKKIKNLYYVGQYTNPGVGVPICLLSSQIVYGLIRKNHG